MEKKTITIERTLTSKEVKENVITIEKKYRVFFPGKEVVINGRTYGIYKYSSTIYIKGVNDLHKDNARVGTRIKLSRKDDNQFEIEYFNGTDCSDKKRSCIDTPYTTLSVLQDVLDKMKESYHGIIVDQKYLPTRDKIGLTERNLTFYFCHHYLELRKDNIKNIIVWQEMPLESDIYNKKDNHRQHIDSIIIDRHDDAIDIFYIEAKRIFDSSFVTGTKSSLKKDLDRIMKNYKLLPHYKDIIKNVTKIHHHIVLLAGLDILKGQRPNTINNKKNALNKFREDNYFTTENLREFWEVEDKNDVESKNESVLSEYKIFLFYKEITKQNDTTE